MSEKDEITVQVKFGRLEQTFKGKPEEVWILLNRFFAKTFPALKILKNITLTVDVEKLIEDLKGAIEVSEEGAYILIPKNKLTDKELLMLCLLGKRLAYMLGISEKDSLSRNELREELDKSAKIVSTRLGELCREKLVARTENDEYRITDFGIRHFQMNILPRIRAKIA